MGLDFCKMSGWLVLAKAIRCGQLRPMTNNENNYESTRLSLYYTILSFRNAICTVHSGDNKFI